MCARQAILSNLPAELLVAITKYLEISDSLSLCATSRHLQNVLRDNTYIAYFQALPPPHISAAIRNPLRWACEQTPCESPSLAIHVAKRCLALGVDPNSQAFAALPKRFDIDSDRKTGTCLHAAVHHESLELVQLLLEYGADPMLCDELGETALYRAAEHLTPRSGECTTIFMIVAAALSQTRRKAVSTEDGGDIEQSVRSLETTLPQRFPSLPVLLSESEIHKLMLDNCPYPSRVQVLLDLGAPVDAKNNEGITVLSSIAGSWTSDHKGPKEEQCKTAALLVERGADIETRSLDKYGSIDTPLSLAVDHGCDDMVRLLVREGAELGAPCYEDGRTIAMCCAGCGCDTHLASLELILTVDQKRDEGMDLVEIKQNRAAELLSQKDEDGETAMGWAVGCDRPIAVRMLLAHGAVLEMPKGAPPRDDRAATVAAFRELIANEKVGEAAVLLHVLQEDQDKHRGKWFGGELDLRYADALTVLDQVKKDRNLSGVDFFLCKDEERRHQVYERVDLPDSDDSDEGEED